MPQKTERKATLSELIGRQIQNLITERQLKPNDRLPAERELAEQFGVSRTVVREGLRGLAAKGLLEVTPSREGTTVRPPSTQTLSEIMRLFLHSDTRASDYQNLLEVRCALEVAIAGLAAQRRTTEDLKQTTRILDDTLAVGDDCDRFVRCDLAFHRALADATHNRLFPSAPRGGERIDGRGASGRHALQGDEESAD